MQVHFGFERLLTELVSVEVPAYSKFDDKTFGKALGHFEQPIMRRVGGCMVHAFPPLRVASYALLYELAACRVR